MNIYVSYVIVNSFTLKLLVKYKAFALTGRIAHCHYTQGNALGCWGGNLSPCKGKSFKTPGNI
jgi:hypothetical protein